MIQRIQSVYLLVAIILQTMLIFLPLAHFTTTGELSEMYTSGILQGESVLLKTTSLDLLCVGIVLISVVALGLFKNRILQMRLCIYNIILNLGLIALIIYIVYYFSTNFQAQDYSYTWVISFPGICAVLHSLAYRSVRKDEDLVRSQDRLR